jgi:Fic family protein
MMTRFFQAYSNPNILATNQPVAIAAAHHRLAWIHPFGDGNGRVARLYSQACFIRAGIDGFGLWTLSRGLARRRSAYFAALDAADQKRWNDLDGRGNLSDRALADFCCFFLETVLDQIQFMSGLFQFENFAKRIDHHLRFNLLQLKKRDLERLSRLLRAVLINGELHRGQVGEVVGLSDSAARQLARLAEQQGLLTSNSPKGPLSLVFNSYTLESYFPGLYQDLPIE